MATHSRILAWGIHGQRGLVAYSPWDLKESEATELLLQFTYYTLGHLETASLLFLHATLQVHYHFCFNDGKKKMKQVPCSRSHQMWCQVSNPGLIPEMGRSPGEGNGNPFLYSCLENPMDRGAWLAIVHRVAKRHEWSDLTSMHASVINTRVEKRWKQEWAKGKILSWTLFINILSQ